MSNLSCGTRVAEPSANKDCRKLLNQFCRFLPKLKLPISADAKLPLTRRHFSGKEDQSFLGAGIPLLDFGARMYNPAIARWTAADPLSARYYGISPYV